MNRRKFLKAGSLAMVAAAGLPKAVRSMQEDPAPTVYRTKPEAGSPGQTLYEISIYHHAVEKPGDASDDDKMITLKVAYFEGTDFTKPAKQAEYRYKIKDTEYIDGAAAYWKITTKLDKKVSGDLKLNKDLPKNLKFHCTKFKSVDILSKDGYSFINLPYPVKSKSSNSSGCFLTTACVQHRQLPDDCFELQTLRSLRDHYMAGSSGGQLLISQYSQIGPTLVKAIDNCDNKAEIYEYMYREMIKPSVELVAQGQLAEAVEYYETFVKALMERY